MWQGFEEDSDLMDRSVTPLAMLAGQEYRLLYPVDDAGSGERGSYEIGEPIGVWQDFTWEGEARG